jgi:hypothetical protein
VFSDGRTWLQPPPLEDIPDSDAIRLAVDQLVSDASQKLPEAAIPRRTLIYDMSQPSGSDVARYNGERQRYFQQLRDWAQGTQDRVLRSLGSIQLELLPINDGAATAEDVEVVLRMSQPGVRFALPEHLEPDEKPEPPRRPRNELDRLMLSGIGRPPGHFMPQGTSDEPPTWELHPLRQQARILQAQIRHGGVRQTISAPLFLVGEADPVMGGFSISWEIVGVRPPVQRDGVLNVAARPRRLGDAADSLDTDEAPHEQGGSN